VHVVPLPPTDDLIREALRLEAEAKVFAERVKANRREARLLRKLAKARGAELPDGESSGNLKPMTDQQLRRRGQQIAKGRAAKSKDPLLIAIAASEWGSQDVYAPQALKVSASMLVGYRKGAYPMPRRLADRIKRDFGIGYDYWRGGIVE
jgi:hypothetical protein